MKNSFTLIVLALFFPVILGSGCAMREPVDYTEFERAKPRSILVLPPLNNSPEVQAGNSFSAWSSVFIGEKGYYILPVALTTETFRQNGLTEPNDIHQLSLKKLRGIFGADAVMYITVERYGTQYMILASQTMVEAHARLVDLRSGKELWKGKAYVDSGSQSGGGSPIAMLLTAAVNQVASSVTDRAHKNIAGPTAKALYCEKGYGLLPGPYYPVEKSK